MKYYAICRGQKEVINDKGYLKENNLDGLISLLPFSFLGSGHDEKILSAIDNHRYALYLTPYPGAPQDVVYFYEFEKFFDN